MLVVPYSKFQVDSGRRHSWSKERHQYYVQQFRNYCSTTADFYPKPKNTGRKPHYSTRERHEDPAVIVNRIKEGEEVDPAGSSKSQVEDVELGLSFLDLHKAPEKAFELLLRKDLPLLIKTCQGMCGKEIRPDDDGMLVKSYGIIMWADRKTGQEKSKFGPMYIHFNLHCLETFDRENIYGAGKRYDYKRIQIDNKTQEKLTEAEKGFLIKTGITLPSSQFSL